MTDRIYLDHNACSPMTPAVVGALRAALDAPPCNAGSVHAEGQGARARLEHARRAVKQALGVRGGRVVFTSGATEANNLVLRGWQGDGALLTSTLEHPSVRVVVEDLDREVRWLAHDAGGLLELDALDAAIAAGDLAGVSVMAANNELGTRNPIAAIAARCAAAGVPLHVDAAQVVGRLPFDVPDGVTAVTMSAHKCGGPIGVGALWMRDGFDVDALIRGGHQERGRRAGTEDVLGAIGMAAAFTHADHDAWAALAPVRDALERALVETLGCVVNGAGPRLPNTSNLSFVGRDAEEVIQALDLAGIAVSAGSACTAGSIDVSPVIAALGLDDARTRSAVRISLGPEHVALDVAPLVDRISNALR